MVSTRHFVQLERTAKNEVVSKMRVGEEYGSFFKKIIPT